MHTNTMNIEKAAEDIIYELWYTIAEKLFNRVAEVTNLNDEQKDALKRIALRPNDFQIKIV